MQTIDKIEHNSKYEVLKTNYMSEKFHQHYDWTKLVIRVNDLGLTGFEVYTILKQRYGIQAELAEGYVVMCVISYADTADSLEKLVSALKEIERLYAKTKPLAMQMVVNDEINTLAMTPQQASHTDNETILIEESIGRISADTIMIYPPGIPLIIPGEVISEKVVEMYNFYSRNIGNVLGDNEQQNQITVIKGDR